MTVGRWRASCLFYGSRRQFSASNRIFASIILNCAWRQTSPAVQACANYGCIAVLVWRMPRCSAGRPPLARLVPYRRADGGANGGACDIVRFCVAVNAGMLFSTMVFGGNALCGVGDGCA
ncbi:hypothetical protein AVEN_37651-1 [Araneus ventricosus]|uniref:Uncharacterized protein n=1 Tax=Araneus ventricosus TaxID=182803 RepID=A0A4Y2WNX6_ARAVE|nr:hypothetical protein AVEN_37651-1 [Araneus ventricosus]